MALGEDTMKKMRLRDLLDWPPQSGGAYDSRWRFPTAGEAVVNQLFPLQNERVTFRGEFEGHPHSYHYKASTEKIASRIHAIVAANMGKTVAELGEFEIEIDEP
jgi:hypothetical protein